MQRSWLVLALAICSSALSACSSSSSDGAGSGGEEATRGGDIRTNDVWSGNIKLTGTVTIAPGAVVEIAPGANITCADGSTIYVGGVLKAQAASSHAKLSCGKWNGIVVAQGGKAELSGLEIENAGIGLATSAGALESTFSDGAITQSMRPILVTPGTRMKVANSKMTTPSNVPANETSIAEVYGVLEVSRLDYDAKANEGISVRDGGELTMVDSHIHGENAQDLVSAYGAKKVKVSYSLLTGSHCGFHIAPASSFEIDHVTSDANIYGITIYGSGDGPNTVTSSNITGTAAWLDFQGTNGPVKFEGVYIEGTEVLLGGPPPTIAKVDAKIADAKPR